MRKRLFGPLALFGVMILMGAMLSVTMATYVWAGPNPNDCPSSECTEGYFPLYKLSCFRGGCDPGEYVIYACDGRCSGGGTCSCEPWACGPSFCP